MNFRSSAALLLVAFVGGAIAYGWFASDGNAPWMTKDSAPLVRPAAAPPAAAPVTAFIPAQPVVADSAHTEAMLLGIATRRTVENGKALGNLLPRLQATFGQTQPQAVATLSSVGEQPLSNAALLSEFESVADQLVLPAGTGWKRIQYEALSLFVLRRGDRPISPSTARLDRVRQNLIAGETATALRLVREFPGAPNGADWIAKAEKAIAVQKALDTLDQAALAAITAPKVPSPASLPTEALPAPASTVNPAAESILPAGGE
jgi:hypothetical protein